MTPKSIDQNELAIDTYHDDRNLRLIVSDSSLPHRYHPRTITSHSQLNTFHSIVPIILHNPVSLQIEAIRELVVQAPKLSFEFNKRWALDGMDLTLACRQVSGYINSLEPLSADLFPQLTGMTLKLSRTTFDIPQWMHKFITEITMSNPDHYTIEV